MGCGTEATLSNDEQHVQPLSISLKIQPALQLSVIKQHHIAGTHTIHIRKPTGVCKLGPAVEPSSCWVSGRKLL